MVLIQFIEKFIEADIENCLPYFIVHDSTMNISPSTSSIPNLSESLNKDEDLASCGKLADNHFQQNLYQSQSSLNSYHESFSDGCQSPKSFQKHTTSNEQQNLKAAELLPFKCCFNTKKNVPSVPVFNSTAITSSSVNNCKLHSSTTMESFNESCCKLTKTFRKFSLSTSDLTNMECLQNLNQDLTSQNEWIKFFPNVFPSDYDYLNLEDSAQSPNQKSNFEKHKMLHLHSAHANMTLEILASCSTSAEALYGSEDEEESLPHKSIQFKSMEETNKFNSLSFFPNINNNTQEINKTMPEHEYATIWKKDNRMWLWKNYRKINQETYDNTLEDKDSSHYSSKTSIS